MSGVVVVLLLWCRTGLVLSLCCTRVRDSLLVLYCTVFFYPPVDGWMGKSHPIFTGIALYVCMIGPCMMPLFRVSTGHSTCVSLVPSPPPCAIVGKDCEDRSMKGSVSYKTVRVFFSFVKTKTKTEIEIETETEVQSRPVRYKLEYFLSPPDH